MKNATLTEISNLIFQVKKFWWAETGAVPDVEISFMYDNAGMRVTIQVNKFKRTINASNDLKANIISEVNHFLKLY
jgi:hypothetical protein